MSKTIKVRVAVVVDEGGCWQANGWLNATDAEAEGWAQEHMGIDNCGHTQEVTYFIEAEVPVMAPETIKAKVTP